MFHINLQLIRNQRRTYSSFSQINRIIVNKMIPRCIASVYIMALGQFAVGQFVVGTIRRKKWKKKNLAELNLTNIT